MYWWTRCDMGKYLWPMMTPVTRVIVNPEEMLAPEFNLDGLRFSSDDEDEGGRVLPDFGSYKTFAFFMSGHAVEVFGDIARASGRLIPTTWDGLPYHLMVIHRELDLFDYERSEFDRWGLYDDLKRDVWEIQRVVIRTPPADCPDIFRLKGNKSVHFNIIVSDRFKRLYEENGLTGLFFRRADLPLN